MRRSTEGGEAPGWQGATTENIGNMRGRSNAARRDASPAECRRIYEMSSSVTADGLRRRAWVVCHFIAVRDPAKPGVIRQRTVTVERQIHVSVAREPRLAPACQH